MKILPFGDRALLAEFSTLQHTIEAFRVWDAARIPGIVELVPAASTVLVTVDPTVLSLRAVEQWLDQTLVRASSSDRVNDATTRSVTIPVQYDGPDLASTALLLGFSPDELVARHSQISWRCAFIGFAPGFAYLAAEDSGLEVPRRTTSRATVPAGAVGLAGEFSGIYPRSSPGGWQIIGTTSLSLWDESCAQPATITPGTIVRFEVDES